MAAIVEMFTGDRALQLGSEQYIRPMLIGYNWAKVRVGIYYSIQVPISSRSVVLAMAYGLTCQSKQWWDAGADMAYTLYSTSSLTSPSFALASIGTSGVGSQSQIVNQTKVGAALNTSSAGGGASSCYLSCTIRGILFTDITRGTGQLTFTPWGRAANPPTDQLLANFLTNMETEVGPPFCSTAQMPTGPLAYGGTGLLDSFWFYWGNSIPVISLHALAVCRFY